MYERTCPLDHGPALSLPYKPGRVARSEFTNRHVASRAVAMLSAVSLENVNSRFSRETAVLRLHEEAEDPASVADDLKEHIAPARRR
jgi:hypothetical protein